MSDPWTRKEVIGGLLDEVAFNGFSQAVTLYGLKRRGGTRLVYIGSTSQPIKSRIRSHVGDARKGSLLPVHEWMRQRKMAFVVVYLGTCTEGNRHSEEARLIAKNKPELNLTDGGAGLSGHKFAGTPHAEKIAEKLKTGARFDCEKCGEGFWRKRGEILLGNNRFCSRSCYQEWQRGRPKKRRAAE